MSASDVLKTIQENDVKFIDFRFTDTRGKEQHVSVPASTVDDSTFEDGKMFDGSSIAGWKGIDASDTQALLADEQVRELYVAELNRAQANIKRYERVRDFVLEDDEFSPENGLLTPSLKIKRRAVMAKYGDQIDDMYDGGNPLLGRD